MEHGELGARPLRPAKTTDTVISAGPAIIGWTTEFTFRGFRFVQAEGWNESEKSLLSDKANYTALNMYTDLERTGYLSCSSAWANQLYSNVV
jgi:alpha-L-rhamnosidase